MLYNCHLLSCIIFDRTKGKGIRNVDYKDISKTKPNDLLKNGWEDITHPNKRAKTNSRDYLDQKTGTKLSFDKGKPGATGFEGVDHYHIHNPNRTGKGDYYLDINGNPVPKGSKASHIEIN
ncbi:hypothetical protein LCL95_16025 [Bacillus timonensis]|nr:hypothetical protein [Bacillus timonensis]